MSSWNMKEIKEQAQMARDRMDGSSRAEHIKLTSGTNKIFILPPKNKKSMPWVETRVHEIWMNVKGKRRPKYRAGCGQIKDGNDCPVCEEGREKREKYQDSKNQKKRELCRKFFAKRDVYVAALDLTDRNPKPKLLRLPPSAWKLLCEEIEEVDDGGDIWGLESGRYMIIKGNGRDGLKRRYDVCKFSRKSINILEELGVDEEELLKLVPNLSKLQPKPSDSKLGEILSKLKKSSLDDEDEEEDDDNDDDFEDEKDDEDEDDDEVEAEDDDDDDDFEDDDEDEDDDEEDEEDEDDDDEDDEPPKRKKTKKVVEEKVKKRPKRRKRRLR